MGQERLNWIFSGLILVLLFYISGISGDFHQHKNYSANTNSIKLAPAGSYPYLKRIGNWPYGAAIAVAGDTLRHLVYLGSGGAVLILDVSDLSRPKLVSDVINTTGLVVGLKYNPSTRDLYVATHYEGFQIWDVDDPAFPVLLAKYKNPDPYYFGPPVNNVDYSGDYAILERSYVGVSSIDISDPENPVYVSGDITMGNPARDIYVSSDGRLHATGAQNYVKIYIQPNGYLSAGYTWNTLDGPDFVAANSDAAFLSVGNYLVIINTQSVSYPIWSYVTVGRMYDIVERGDFLYFTVDKKLQIYDVSNYQNPVAAGSYTAPSYPNKLDVLGSIAYIADDWSGLRSVNVEDPNQPVELGYFETFSSTINTVRSGDYAYMAEADDGMLVMDLKDLANPSLIGQYNTPGNANAVRVEGNIAYIADGDGGLRIADITNPTQPTEISAFDSLNWAREVCISGNYAYVVDDILNLPDWIRAIDISDPANPIEVGSILMPDNVDALDAAGNYLYAAATDAVVNMLTWPLPIGKGE
jgi:hypothetical protein